MTDPMKDPLGYARATIAKLVHEGETAGSREYLLVDVYGDRMELRLFVDADGIDDAIQEWRELDREYCAGSEHTTNWKPFGEWMDERGFKPLPWKWVVL